MRWLKHAFHEDALSHWQTSNVTLELLLIKEAGSLVFQHIG